MPVPVELLRFFERMAPGPADSAPGPAAELDDLGDAEVAAAEAAISNVKVPELEESAIPPVPELPQVEPVPEVPHVEEAVLPGVGEVAASDVASEDGA
jgi:hypothetical protein